MIGIKKPTSPFAMIEPRRYQLLPIEQLRVPMPSVAAPKEAASKAKSKPGRPSKKPPKK
jgi:hypothetical protein